MTMRLLVLGVLLSGCSLVSVRGDDGDLMSSAELPVVEVEFFDAAKAGQLQVAVIPHNFSVMTMRVRNTTSDTLQVRLPDTLAAIPTARWQAQQMLKQSGVPPSLAQNYPPSQSGSQGLGFSLSGPWADQKPQIAQGAAQNRNEEQIEPQSWILAPGQLIQFQVPCFCLEYGKPDPHRRIPYQLVELQDLTNQPAVKELLQRFGQGGLDQRVAQLAAWHLASGVPWPMLAQLRLPRTAGRGAGGVTPQELLAARQLCELLPSYSQTPSLGNPAFQERQR